MNDLALPIQSLQINRLLSVFGFINYQYFKGIYKTTQNNDYMFECPNFDLLKSTNQKAFAAAMLIFWDYQLPEF